MSSSDDAAELGAELICSEVHVDADNTRTTLTSSIFHVVVPTALLQAIETPTVLPLELWHGNATPVALLGIQLWPAALALASYILDRHELFTGKTVLEMGAGTGLVSMMCLLVGCRRVVATDGGPCHRKVLNNCRLNLESLQLQLTECNITTTSVLPFMATSSNKPECSIYMGSFDVLKLDWLSDGDIPLTEQYSDIDIIVAADDTFTLESFPSLLIHSLMYTLLVIYDDHLTDGFLNKVMQLLCSNHGSTLYLTMEKRYNFMIGDCKPTAKAYEYLCERIAKWYRSHITLQRVLIDDNLEATVSRWGHDDAIDDDEIISFDPISQKDLNPVSHMVVEEGSRKDIEIWRICWHR